MEGALAKRNHEPYWKGTDTKDNDEDGNLLAHFVKHTQSKKSLLNFLFDYFMHFGTL